MTFVQALHQLSMFGGTDISELFEERSINKLEMFDLKSNTQYGNDNDLFWWNDPTCIIGGITAQERHICVRNKAKGNYLMTYGQFTVSEVNFNPTGNKFLEANISLTFSVQFPTKILSFSLSTLRFEINLDEHKLTVNNIKF